jgi:hypothetical protein
MRTSYIVTYDISDDKRLRKVFQTMRKKRGPRSEVRARSGWRKTISERPRDPGLAIRFVVPW